MQTANRHQIAQVLEINNKSLNVKIPVIGRIAAGVPIEAIETTVSMSLDTLLGGGELVALEVRGDSLVEEGILNGDKVICRLQNTAKEGEIVFALTHRRDIALKRISYKVKNRIILYPSNVKQLPQAYSPAEVEILGIYVGLLRINSSTPR